jgi:hypothetical protein
MYENTKERNLDKKVKILNYFFQHPKDLIKTKDMKKDLLISPNQNRTFIRNCQFFHYYGVIDSKNDITLDTSTPYNSKIKEYDTAYRLTQNEKVKFQIPTDSIKRKNYATLITQLFTDDKDGYVGIDNEEFILPIVNSTIFNTIKNFSTGIIRETFLSVNVYDYFKNKRGSMLSILLELLHFNQQIKLEIKSEDSMTIIEKTKIETVTINEDGSIELGLKNMNIKLNSLNEILNILILSKNYPHLKSGIASMNKKTFIESLNESDTIGKIKEAFVNIMEDLQTEFDDEVDMDFDKYIDNLLKDKVNGLSIIERSNKSISITN